MSTKKEEKSISSTSNANYQSPSKSNTKDIDNEKKEEHEPTIVSTSKSPPKTQKSIKDKNS